MSAGLEDSTPLVGTLTAPAAGAPLRKASIPSSWINLSNTILGAGMLGVPYAIGKAGLGFGFFMLVLCGFLAGLGLHLLSLACAEAELTTGSNAPGTDAGSDFSSRSSTSMTHFTDYGGKDQPPFPHSSTIPVASFFKFAKMTYPSLRYVIDGAIAVKCFGVSISYLIVCADLMPEVMTDLLGKDGPEYLYTRWFWVLCSAALCWPLAFLPRLDSLKYASVVALGSMAYLVFIIVYFFFEGAKYDNLKHIRWVPSSGIEMAANVPIFVFAFTCSQNLPTIAAELPRAYGSRINTVIVLAMSTCVLAYAIIGGFGYVSFLDKLESDIVKNYKENTIVTVGRIALVINVLLSFPLQVHPARNSLDSLLFPTLAPHEKSVPRVFLETMFRRVGATLTRAVPILGRISSQRLRFICETVAICSGAYAVAFRFSSLGLMFIIVGATGSTTIAYILPGLFSFKLLEHAGWSWKRIASLGLVILGFCVMFSALTIIVLANVPHDDPILKVKLAG